MFFSYRRLGNVSKPSWSIRFEEMFLQMTDFTRSVGKFFFYSMDRRQLAIETSFSHLPLSFELRNSPRSRGPASILAWRLGQLVGGLRTISICLSRNRGDHGNRNFPHPWPPLPLFLHNFSRTLSHPHDPLSLSIFCRSRRIFPSCFSFSLSWLCHLENLATTVVSIGVTSDRRPSRREGDTIVYFAT